jgi:signal transduction histidine kinase
MWATGWLSPNRLDLGWVAMSAVWLGAMVLWPSWETIPFHLIWISLTLLYGFRVWSLRKTAVILGGVVIATGASILSDAFAGFQLWGELFEVPLMSAMFLAMVWHARRRVQAQRTVEALADERAALLEQEEQLLHDVSHELRTPVTIARGHLELLDRRLPGEQPELAVAFDELRRIESIVDRLLFLARAERSGFMQPSTIELVPFLEDVFMRWAELAPRTWRLGEIVDVELTVDESWLRTALDALLENAVQYSDGYDRIELSASGQGDMVVVAVEDEGHGISAEALPHVFERFARSDSSRTRRAGGAGLGLAIVDAVARAHGGFCSARSSAGGSTFEIHVPLSQASRADRESAAGEAAEPVPAF